MNKPTPMPDAMTFEALQTAYFAEHDLIIAANRGPVTFFTDESGKPDFRRGEGGLVTALTGLCRYADATWIASAQAEADAIFDHGTITLDENTRVRLRFLPFARDVYDAYYNVIANPLLWFLQHSMWDVPRAPIIDRATWTAWESGYVIANQKFAQAIVRQVQANARPTLVMVQDYQLYLTPGFIRKALKPRERPTVLHFVHIPWPGPEYWGILPPTMRTAILEGLCAADLLGFQTQQDAHNFMRTCKYHLPGRVGVRYNKGRLWYRNHTTHVRDFPISIDVDALRRKARTREVQRYRQELETLIGERQLILRVDRLEPSKNIVRGFLAFEELLEVYPEHLGKIKFVAVLVPSRLGVEEYQAYLDEVMAAVGRINARYGTSGWEPVRVLVGQNYPRAVAAMQLYDVLLVNSIADGMNLVAKEGPIVNRREGVLVLSEQTGARQQLGEGALVISPCDVYATAEALHAALTMPRTERRERAQQLRHIVEEEDIAAWLHQQLHVLSTLKLTH